MDGMLEVLRLINSLGEVKGRKKLQKIVHILQSCGYDFPQRFGYLHYGPYSSQLAAEVDSLVGGELVAEKGDGNDYSPYIYAPNESAKKLLKEVDPAHAPKWKALAIKLNENNPNHLEAMSTILYLKANGFAGQGLKERFMSLKPHLKSVFERACQEAATLQKAV